MEKMGIKPILIVTIIVTIIIPITIAGILAVLSIPSIQQQNPEMVTDEEQNSNLNSNSTY